MHGQRAPSPSNRERLFGSRGKRIASVLMLLAICAFPVICLARAEEQVLVLLLRRVPADAIFNEAILRIKSELLAGGFQVAVADSDGAEADPRALMERAGRAQAPSATIAIFGDLHQGTAELWVVDHISNMTVVRRLDVQASPEQPIVEVLAIRAQELLRASLVELGVQEHRPEPPVAPPPQIQHVVKQAVGTALASWTFGLELGAATFGGWGGIGPTLAPAARLRMALDERFWVRLTALGLGTRPRVDSDLGSDVGSARIGQDVLLLEFAAWLRPSRQLHPTFSLGLGGVRIAVDGTAQAPFQGEHNARLYAAGDVGAGVALRLLAHWEAQLEVHALFTAPRPSIRFFNVEAAHVTQPTLMAILTMAGGG